MPLTIDRILLVVLVGQYVLYRRWGRADPKPLGKPEIVLCLFTAWMVVSTFTRRLDRRSTISRSRG